MSASWKASVPISDRSGNGDHRDGVHLRIGQRGDQVRRTRTGGGHHDPDASGGVGITAGGMARTLLMADQDVAQLLGVEQRVVDRQNRAAGDPEDHLDAEFLQRPHHRLGAGELLGRDALGALATGMVVMGAVGLGRRRLGRSLRRCAHCCPRYPSLFADKKKPPSAGQLYEGCALVRLVRPGRGPARHQRADLLLRAFHRSTYLQRVVAAQVKRQILGVPRTTRTSAMMLGCPPAKPPHPKPPRPKPPLPRTQNRTPNRW
jgi:hypothetical protein